MDPAPALRPHLDSKRIGEHPSMLADGIDIAGDAGLKWQCKPIFGLVAIARNHMQVKMEDRLPCVGATAVEQVDAVGAEVGEHDLGDPLSSQNGSREVVGRDLDEIGAVSLRNHQQMAVRARIDVHEGERCLILDHLRAPNPPSSNPAEHALVR